MAQFSEPNENYYQTKSNLAVPYIDDYMLRHPNLPPGIRDPQKLWVPQISEMVHGFCVTQTYHVILYGQTDRQTDPGSATDA